MVKWVVHILRIIFSHGSFCPVLFCEGVVGLRWNGWGPGEKVLQVHFTGCHNVRSLQVVFPWTGRDRGWSQPPPPPSPLILALLETRRLTTKLIEREGHEPSTCGKTITWGPRIMSQKTWQITNQTQCANILLEYTYFWQPEFSFRSLQMKCIFWKKTTTFLLKLCVFYRSRQINGFQLKRHFVWRGCLWR